MRHVRGKDEEEEKDIYICIETAGGKEAKEKNNTERKTWERKEKIVLQAVIVTRWAPVSGTELI